MKIVTINVGSSTIKYARYETERFVYSGRIDRIGTPQAYVLEDKRIEHIKARTFVQALDWLKQRIKTPDAVSYRVVYAHGFDKPCIVTKKLLDKIKEGTLVAPLHNPWILKTILNFKRQFKVAKHIAVFDTYVHNTISDRNKMYAIPKKYTGQIQKNGFHGLVVESVISKLKQNGRHNKKILVIHLGNGCSVTAVKNNRVVNTSMGYTPLDGIMMSTRCGAIDPGAILGLVKKVGVSKTEKILWTESGLKALGGASDLRDLRGRKQSRGVLDAFLDSIVRIIGMYYFELGGADVIVFSGGIAENETWFLKRIFKRLNFLDLRFNKQKRGLITIPKSEIEVYVLNADEQEMLKRHACTLLRKILRNNRKKNA